MLGRVIDVFLRGTTTPFIIVVSLLVGLVAMLGTAREEEPQIVVPMADVFVEAPGLPVAEVERQVVTPLEKLLHQIDGVEHVYSVARPGSAVVTVRFFVGEDREESLVKIYNKIYSNTDLVPPDVASWVVKPIEIDDVPIVIVTLWSRQPSLVDDHQLRRIAEELEIELQALPETNRSSVVGGRPRVVRVELDPQALAARQTSALDVAWALRVSNAEARAGSLDRLDRSLPVDVGTFFGGVEALRRAVVNVVEGSPVLLQDVARVLDGPAEPESYTWIGFGPADDGPGAVAHGSFYPAVHITVAKQKGSNAVEVARRIEARVAELAPSLFPEGVEARITRNYGETANDKVNELLEALAVALVIVIALIAWALGWREGLIVAAAVPITFALTLLINYWAGYTINRVTLFALILSLGLVVDDPVVDVENIYRRLRLRAEPPLEAIRTAVNEVRPPILLATLAVVVSFLPMYLITGMMGPYMSPMALNVPVAMLMSMAVAFMVTPWLSWRVLRRRAARPGVPGRGAGPPRCRRAGPPGAPQARDPGRLRGRAHPCRRDRRDRHRLRRRARVLQLQPPAEPRDRRRRGGAGGLGGGRIQVPRAARADRLMLRPQLGAAPRRPTGYRVLGRYLKPYRGALGVATALTMAVTVLDLARPWPLKLAVDHAIGRQPLTGMLAPLGDLGPATLAAVAALASLALVAVGAVVAYLETYLSSAAAERVGADLRESLYGRLLGLALPFHDRHRSGDLVTRLTGDVARVEDSLVALFTTLIPEVLTLVGMAVVLLAIDPVMGVAALAVAPPLALVVALRRRRIRDAQRASRDAGARLASEATDVLRNVRAVQAFTREDEALGRFRGRSRHALGTVLAAMDLEARYAPVANLLLAAGGGLVLWFGVVRVTSGHITLGTLLVVLSYLSSIYGPIRSLARLARTLARGAASRERILDVLASPEAVPSAPSATPAGPPRHGIALRGVSFAYPGGPPVLRGVDLEIAAGERICVVGATGAGKSTLLALLLRFYDPGGGAIEVDGVDLRRLDLASLRRQVALVPQDPWILDGTIAGNIAFGRPGAGDHEVLRAAREALVDEFAERLPDGYQTVVGEAGVLLSGGQRRRIALARAILRDASVLLLDEPTSGLDAVSEQAVLRGIERAARGRTVVSVSHRLGLATSAERVVVLDAGRVVEEGPPPELLAAGGPFARLWAARPPGGPEAPETPRTLTLEGR